MTFAFFAEVVSHQHAYLLYNCCSALPSATILAFSSWIKPTIFVTGLAMSDAETNGTTVQSSINVRITKKDSLVELDGEYNLARSVETHGGFPHSDRTQLP